MAKELTDKESRFVTAFLGEANGNAAKAAELAGYGKTSAKVTGSRLLKKPKVQAALVSLRANRVSQALQADEIVRARVMTGDEALERLTLFARVDATEFLDPEDSLRALPADLRACIKSVKETKFGRNIEFHDAMRATELLAKAGGKLKEIVQVESLEDLIAQSMQPPTAAEASA